MTETVAPPLTVSDASRNQVGALARVWMHQSSYARLRHRLNITATTRARADWGLAVLEFIDASMVLAAAKDHRSPLWAAATARERMFTLATQLRELRQREQSIQRQQADAIDLGWWSASNVIVLSGENVGRADGWVLAVENKSSRPIRNVVCRLYPENDPENRCNPVRCLSIQTARSVARESTPPRRTTVFRWYAQAPGSGTSSGLVLRTSEPGAASHGSMTTLAPTGSSTWTCT